jgi:LruC domain-containing protein
MVRFSSILKKTCWGFIIAISMTACIDKSKYEMTYDPNNPESVTSLKVANSFDFSTVQKVNLTVDYSAFKTYGPVFFGVYTENPFITIEGEPDDKWNEDVEPIYEDYTEANGKFNAVVELPAYAQHLYIATGNFFTGMMLLEADVNNGSASVVAENYNAVAEARMVTRAAGPGESTSDLSKLNLTNTVDDNGKNTGERIYNDWKNWLGSWNSATGCPDYLLDKATADPALVISEEEMEGLYGVVGSAFTSGSALNSEYSSYPDLLLQQDSEVTFTLLGGSTCWNSSLGYYYYTDDHKPTKPSDIHPIMLFPNTQDGQWARASTLKLKSYNNNIGTLRGDVVQLMYYPNIANNDNTGATKTFPKGTRIGFILKTQGWGMQGRDYSLNADKLHNNGFKNFNWWSSTTDGVSYGTLLSIDIKNKKVPNLEGSSRGAKFSYKATNGDTYTLISFEDAMDDEDYDDLIFALKPVGVFASLPEVADRKSSTNGVYAFEDMWPKKGDYDLNDALVNVKHEKQFNNNGKINKETFYLTTYQNYVELISGLALTLETKVTPKTVSMKKIAAGSTDAEKASFTKDNNIYYLTDDIKQEIGTTYILELTYGSALSSSSQMASIKPFIYRSEDKLNWEVHIPMEAPTDKMNLNYLGQDDDCSDYIHNLFFIRQGNYPFAFYLKNADINVFKETILKRENESIPIDEFFPGFLDWSISGGTTNQDWYLNHE